MELTGDNATPLYDPWSDLASRPHLTYVTTRLPLADAWYLPDVPGIAMDDRLTRTERRCVLAHELAHIDLGHHHQPAGNGPGTSRMARRNERDADMLAARRLICIYRLAAALAEERHCRWHVAELLDVTEQLLQVRLEHLHPSERALLKRVLTDETREIA